MNAETLRVGKEVVTKGLLRDYHPEISIAVNDPTLYSESAAFLRHVIEYLHQTGNRLRNGETLRYGYWMTKFVGDDRMLRVWEHNADVSSFVAGGDLTLSYWKAQQEVCTGSGSSFAPPRPDQLIVVSKGVLEGAPVQGVRYPSPEHMSGWWVTADDYDGRPETLQTHHCYHVTAARQDLASYLALDHGFRFGADGRVWFDPEVAAEPAN